MHEVAELVQKVLSGALFPEAGAQELRHWLNWQEDGREYSRSTCAYRLCRSLAGAMGRPGGEGNWADVAGHLRQVMLTFGESFRLASEICSTLRPLAQMFGLLIDSECVISPLKVLPSWLKHPEGFWQIYNYPWRRQACPVPGDGILFQASGHAHYISRAQKAVVQAGLRLLPGHTLLACLPTGGGKSLAGQLPAWFYIGGGRPGGATGGAGTTVVVVPTIALALDQARASRNLFEGAPGEEYLPRAYHSKIPDSEREIIFNGLQNGTLPLLYISPEAILNSAFQEVMLAAAGCGRLTTLVVDEAHIVVDWGVSFRPEFQYLAPFRRKLLQVGGGRLRTILLSATLTEDTSRTLREMFAEGDNLVEIRADALRPEIMFWLDRSETEEERQDKILELLPLMPKPLILYVISPERAWEWHRLITGMGFSRAAAFTGKTGENERNAILNMWKEDRLDIIVATSAFGMGVDKPDVRSVIHCCLPESINRFYQEVGRGGRDGFPSISLLSVVSQSDAKESFDLIKRKVLTAEKIAVRWDSLRDNVLERTSGDTFWVDTDVKPEYLQDEFTGMRNASFNDITLLFLYRQGLIDILDIRRPLGDERRHVMVQLKEIEILHDRPRLIEYIRDLREAEWGQIKEDYKKMVQLASHKNVQCWSKYFAEIYPYADELCGGCPPCRQRGREASEQSYLPDMVDINHSWEAGSAPLSRKLATALGFNREILITLGRPGEEVWEELPELLNELILSGVTNLVLFPLPKMDWSSICARLAYRNCRPYGIYGPEEAEDLLSYPWVKGPLALLYPDATGEVDQAYHWGRRYLQKDQSGQVIHLAPANLFVPGQQRPLEELVDGISIPARQLLI